MGHGCSNPSHAVADANIQVKIVFEVFKVFKVDGIGFGVSAFPL